MSCHLVLMPGFDGTGELFAPLIGALGPSDSFTVVRYTDERSLEACVNTAAALLPDEPASDKPAILVAESFSGPIALALAARFPQRVQCTVLCATFAVSPFRSLLSVAGRLPEPLIAHRSLRHLALQTLCLNGMRERELIELSMRVAGAMSAETIRARLQVLREIDLREKLKAITVPTLYLRASRDRIVSRRLGQELIEGLVNVEVREIDGPHMLLQSKPVECAAAIHEFIERTTGL